MEPGSSAADDDPSDGDGPLDVWQYKGRGNTHALTIVEDGSNLPTRDGPWALVRATRLESDAFDAVEARRMIRQHGYVCYD